MNPLQVRLLKRTAVDEKGCWVWQGPADRHGYGKVKVRGRTEQVHRIAYKEIGPAFDLSLTLDHLCRNTLCWRTDHLEPVTQRVNNYRNPDFSGNRTHCPQGHEYTPENTYKHPRGERVCRACRKRWRKQVHESDLGK